VAKRVAEYAVPCCPLAKEDVVICRVLTEAAMVMLNVLDAVWAGELESFTWTVKEEVPDPVGVPVICPEELPSVSPAGNEPEVTDQL